MKAIILAAGRGSRMQQHTEIQPKCMTQLIDKPLLDWQLGALRDAGINDIAVVTGYQNQYLKQYVPQLTYFTNERWQETNMVASLCCAEAWLVESPCIISYSDIVYDAEPIKQLLACDDDMAITYDPWWHELWSLRFNDPLDDAETFAVNANSMLTEIGHRPQTLKQIQGQYMGLLMIKPNAWQRISAYIDSLSDQARDPLDMTSLLQGLLDKQMPIKALPIQSRWYEVDNPNDLQVYKSLHAQLPQGLLSPRADNSP